MKIYFNLSLGFSLISVLAFFISRGLDLDAGYGAYYLRVPATDALVVFAKCSALYALGALVGAKLTRPRKRSSPPDQGKAPSFKSSIKTGASLSALGYFLILFTVYESSEQLLGRSHYHIEFESQGIELIFSYISLAIGLIPAATVLAFPDKRVYRAWSTVLCITSAFTLFSIGTKFVAACLLSFSIALFLKNRKRLFLSIVLTLLGALFFVATLSQRLYQNYGLLSILEITNTIQTGAIEAVELAADVLISPIYITAQSTEMRDPNIDLLLIELNPLPGTSAGWYEVADDQRIGPAVPFNTIGTLSAYSSFLIVIYAAVSSLSLALLYRSISRLLPRYASLVVVALSILHLGIVLQYNLRSSTRWIYLFFGLSIVLVAFHRLKARQSPDSDKSK